MASIRRNTASRKIAKAGEQLSFGLGCASIGLGLVELLAPRRVANATGLQQRPALIRSLGVREIVTGIALLRKPGPFWLWGRVVGDLMDLAVLRTTHRPTIGGVRRAEGTRRVVLGATAVDLCAAVIALGSPRYQRAAAREVRATVTINRPAHELYAFWRDLRNLPNIMPHLDSVEILDDRLSRWRAKAPAGMHLSWDAQIVDDVANRRIAWASMPGADVQHLGSVHFQPAPGDRGTYVTAQFRYVPPAGRVGAFIAKTMGASPEQRLHDDLRRFKQFMETGEIATTYGQTSGRLKPTGRGKMKSNGHWQGHHDVHDPSSKADLLANLTPG